MKTQDDKKADPQALWAVVKVTVKAHGVAKKLMKQIAGKGWTSYGIDRDDPVSLGAVVEEALRFFAAQKHG
jgi:hypothetical protein